MIIRNGSLASKAYDIIRKKIFDNDVKPGDLISESLIAEEIGISRTPVREAIKMLANEGILETRDGIGTIVKMLSIKEIRDVFEVRKALEIIAAKSSVNIIPEYEIIELLEKYSDINSRFNAGESIEKEFADIDLQVHNLIIYNCDNDYVKSLFDSIILKIKLYQYVQYVNFESNAESIMQHIEILIHLKNRDIDQLLVVLNDHMDWSLKWYLGALMHYK